MHAGALLSRTRPAKAPTAFADGRWDDYGAGPDDPWEAMALRADATARAYDRASYPGRRSSRHGRALGAALALVGVALAALCTMVTLMAADAMTGRADVGGMGVPGASAAAEADPQSTPRSQWARGSVPFLYQRDRAWSGEPYGDGTIGTHGCGPTALAMACVALTGRADCDPAAMARYSERAGFVDGGMTAWALMSSGAEGLGLASEELPPAAEAVRAHLLADHPVICSVGPGDFTTDGHFIVLVDANPNGTVALRDPNSPARSAQAWDLDRVLGQCRNLWALSR